MQILDVIKQLEERNVILFPDTEIDQFLEGVIVKKELESKLGGKMRVVDYYGVLLFQEFTDKGEAAVRKVNNMPEAESIINERLETYDRMWDGCGCRVDYYN